MRNSYRKLSRRSLNRIYFVTLGFSFVSFITITSYVLNQKIWFLFSRVLQRVQGYEYKKVKV